MALTNNFCTRSTGEGVVVGHRNRMKALTLGYRNQLVYSDRAVRYSCMTM